MDLSINDPINDTVVVNESQWETLKRNLLEEFDTPMKVVEKSGDVKLIPSVSEHMKVYLRIRPFTPEELARGEDQGCMEVEDENSLATRAPKDSHTYKNRKHDGKTNHHFTFSKIFGPDTTQKVFFDETVLNVVKNFIEGINCLVFTYGVTNSGKTYTIQGEPNDCGILPRSLDVIFNSIFDKQWHDTSLKPKMFCEVAKLGQAEMEQELKIKDAILKMAVTTDEPDMSSLMGDSDSSHMSASSTLSQDSLMMPPPAKCARNTDSLENIAKDSDVDFDDEKSKLEAIFASVHSRVREEASVSVETQGQIRFSLWVSYCEVYNEYVYDLLEPLPKKKTLKRQCLHLREDKKGIPYAKGLKEIHVTSADEAYKIMTIGKQNLQMACTKLNRNSSRSHCIFTIKMIRIVDKDDPHMARISMLSFCDLAGSERYSKTAVQGDRMKEAGNINTSLLTLGRCIKVLRHNQLQRKKAEDVHRDMQIVPFRDSKLTRLFQSFFCGKGKAAMIVNINQNASTFDETLHALKYSAIAKQVVVVQEATNEPPKRKKLSKAKSIHPRTSRMMATDMSQAHSNALSRATIGWATPGTLAQDMAELEQHSLNLPAPVEVEEQDEEEEDLVEEDSMETINPDREEELIGIILKLKDELVAEKKRNMVLENEIRQEVCEEMAQQLIEIENSYEEKVKEERSLAEEMAEKRLELYMRSVKKAKKRKRMFEEEEEELVPNIYLHQEQVKVKELEGKLVELQKDLDEARANIKVIIDERENLQQENTKIVFQLAELKSQTEKKNAALSAKPNMPGHDDLSHKEVVLQMQARLQQAQDELAQKSKEVDDLSEMLVEAAETFQQKEKEISDLEKSINALEAAAVESRSALNEAMQKLKEEQELILELEEKLIAEQQKECTNCQIQTSEMGKVIAQLADRESELEEMKTTEAKLKSEIEKLQVEVVAKQQMVESLSVKVEKFSKLLSEKDETVMSLRDMVKQDKDSDDSHVSRLLEQISNLETQLDEARNGQEAEADAVIKLKSQVERYEKAVANQEVFTSNLNKQVEEASERIITLQQAEKSAREELEKQIRSLKEELSSTSQELTKKEAKLQEDCRRSVKLEDRLEAMEQSLQAANAAVREKTIEADALAEKLAKLEEKEECSSTKCEELAKQLDQALYSAEKVAEDVKVDLKRLQDQLQQHADCENRFESMQQQLDDYILKVNEQAVENGELKDKVEDVEKQLKVLTAKKEKFESQVVAKESELISLRSKVDDLKVRLNCERKQQKEANGELGNVLQEKAIQIEELESKVSTLSSQMQWKQREHDSYKKKEKEYEEKLKDIEKTYQESLNNQKEEFKTVKANEGKLLQELEAARNVMVEMKKQIAMMEESLKKNKKNSEEVNNISAQLNNNIKDLEVELMEATGKISKLEFELAKCQGLLQISEDKVAKLVSQKNLDKEESCKEDSDADKEIENLKKKCREMEGQLSEAEYKAQMTSRQLRREKSQVESKLKEKEKELTELEKKFEEANCKLRSLDSYQSGTVEQLRLDVEEQRNRAERFDGVIKELENCLTSSKASQAEAQEQVAKYKQKCRDLEEDLAKKEDIVQGLQGVHSELQELMEEKKEADARWRHQVEQLNDLVNDLEHKLKESKAEVQMLEGKLGDLGILEEKNNNLISELESRDEHIHELMQMLANEEKKFLNLKTEKDQLNQMMSDTHGEAGKKIEKLNKRCNSLQATVKEVEEKLKQTDSHAEEKEQQCRNLEDELVKLKENLASTHSKVNNLEEQLEKSAEESNGSLKQKSQKIEELTSEVQKLESEKNAILETLNDKNKEIEDLANKLQKLQSEKKSLHETLEEKEREFQMLKLQVESLQKEKSELDKSMSEKSEEIEHLKAELETLKAIQADQKEILQEKDAKMEKNMEELKKIEERLQKLEEDLECEKANKQKLVLQLKMREESIEVYSKEKELLKEEITTLAAQVEKLTSSEFALRDTLTAMQIEMEKKTRKVDQLEEKLVKNAEKVTEQQVLLDDLEKSQEREKKRRQELQESAQRLQEQNVKFNLQTDQLKAALERCEKAERLAREHKSSVENLTGKLSSVQQELTKVKEDHDEEMRKVKREVRKKEDEIDYLKIELEQKEKKLKQKINTIGDLMVKIEAETNSCDIAVKDNKLNDRVIEEMKKVMEEQEETMEAQDKVLQSKEADIQELHKELDEQFTKYEKLLRTHSATSSSLRQAESLCQQLEQKLKLAESKVSSTDELIREHKRELEKAEKDKARAERDLQDTNKELIQIEKLLSESRHECQMLKENQSQLADVSMKAEQIKKASDDKENKLMLLKQKFASLENQCKELQQEGERLRKEARVAEIKKEEELKKWREDRDKLVKQLEVILKQKEKELSELKKDHPIVKQEQGYSSNESDLVRQLRADLKDREDMIATLSRHLDVQTPGSKTRRMTTRGCTPSKNQRHTSDSEDSHERSSTGSLRKEVETLYRQLEEERLQHSNRLKKTVKAKDEIIDELKSTNNALQLQIPLTPQISDQLDNRCLKTPCSSIKDGSNEMEKSTSKRRGRAKKRKSSENSEASVEDSATKKRLTGRGRKSTKKSMLQQVSFCENDPMGILTIQEEDMVDLDHHKTPSRKRSALTDTLNTPARYIGEMPVENKMAPPVPKEPQAPPRRKTKLRPISPIILKDSPDLEAKSAKTPVPDAHKIVTRQLRTRRKASTAV